MKNEIRAMLINEDRNGDCLVVVEDSPIMVLDMAFEVPRGFRSDGISVPRLFWGLVSPCTNPKSKVAGIFHDYLYRVKPSGCTRAFADRAFFRLLLDGKFGLIRAVSCWLAVRLFGWISWRVNSIRKCGGCAMDCKACYRHEDGGDK